MVCIYKEIYVLKILTNITIIFMAGYRISEGVCVCVGGGVSGTRTNTWCSFIPFQPYSYFLMVCIYKEIYVLKILTNITIIFMAGYRISEGVCVGVGGVLFLLPGPHPWVRP